MLLALAGTLVRTVRAKRTLVGQVGLAPQLTGTSRAVPSGTPLVVHERSASRRLLVALSPKRPLRDGVWWAWVEPTWVRLERRCEVAGDRTSITCLACGMTSHHPMDVQRRYCGNCKVFHDD
jgi:hypothetical protein